MASDAGGENPTSLHHRHHHHHHQHHFYVSPQCPLHRSILQPRNHSPLCSFSTSYPAHLNQPVSSAPPDPNSIFLNTPSNKTLDVAQIMQDDEEYEEEGEPIFVLTDEWREFFAKSEAKRKLAKQQAKKKGKN